MPGMPTSEREGGVGEEMASQPRLREWLRVAYIGWISKYADGPKSWASTLEKGLTSTERGTIRKNPEKMFQISRTAVNPRPRARAHRRT